MSSHDPSLNGWYSHSNIDDLNPMGAGPGYNVNYQQALDKDNSFYDRARSLGPSISEVEEQLQCEITNEDEKYGGKEYTAEEYAIEKKRLDEELDAYFPQGMKDEAIQGYEQQMLDIFNLNPLSRIGLMPVQIPKARTHPRMSSCQLYRRPIKPAHNSYNTPTSEELPTIRFKSGYRSPFLDVGEDCLEDAMDQFYMKYASDGDMCAVTIAIEWPDMEGYRSTIQQMPSTRHELLQAVARLVSACIRYDKLRDPTHPDRPLVRFQDVCLNRLYGRDGHYFVQLELDYPKERWKEVIPKSDWLEYFDLEECQY